MKYNNIFMGIILSGSMLGAFAHAAPWHGDNIATFSVHAKVIPSACQIALQKPSLELGAIDAGKDYSANDNQFAIVDTAFDISCSSPVKTAFRMTADKFADNGTDASLGKTTVDGKEVDMAYFSLNYTAYDGISAEQFTPISSADGVAWEKDSKPVLQNVAKYYSWASNKGTEPTASQKVTVNLTGWAYVNPEGIKAVGTDGVELDGSTKISFYYL